MPRGLAVRHGVCVASACSSSRRLAAGMVVGDFFARPQRWPRKNKAAERDVDVWVNVYDLGLFTKYFVNSLMPSQGAYHLGIEVLGMEWCFQAFPDACPENDHTGVCFHLPKKHPEHYFRESVFLGRSPLSRGELRKLFGELDRMWPASRYHYLHCNCVDFAEQVHSLLELPAAFPSWARGCSKGWLQSTPLSSGSSPLSFSSCSSIGSRASSGSMHSPVAIPDDHIEGKGELADGEIASTATVDTGNNDGESLLNAEDKLESWFPGPARQVSTDSLAHTAKRASTSVLYFGVKFLVAIKKAGHFQWLLSLLSSEPRKQATTH